MEDAIYRVTPAENAQKGDTLAFCVLSLPAMFDQCFKPYFVEHYPRRDPVDSCMRYHFAKAVESLPSEWKASFILEFDMQVTR